MNWGDAMKCTVYETGFLKSYKYVVIFASYEGQWLFCRHRERETWETAGGHIEEGETPEEAATRELFEETGATDFSVYPICDYWACDEPHETESISWANGQAFFAHINKIGPLPDSEMAQAERFDTLPEQLTYPDIARCLFPHAERFLTTL